MQTSGLHHALWITCLMVLSGCGGADDVGRIDVSGSATFDGQPIVYGQIDFTPDNAKGHSGPAGYADIVDGKFNTAEGTGSGIVPGAHIVRITAYPQPFPDVEVSDETADTAVPEALFIGYTMEQNVESSTLNIDVPAEAKGRGVSKSP
ncbi:MAG: hypothetical protein GXX96_28550 [Planctomycetaceae bacterium]|nr:hypothetical protein [Planctomycetaceae bacterium]